MTYPADRLSRIAPFYVMEVHKQAQALQAQGRPVIHLSIGEPDFGAPEPVSDALVRAVREGRTGYTEARGLHALRVRISHWYADRFDVTVHPDQILVTSGASGALTLACLALINPGDEVLMPDPSYACNRHFVAAADGHARLLPCTAEYHWQFTANQLAAAWSTTTRGIMVASPANPTGMCLQPDTADSLIAVCQQRNGFLISDEIYQGLVYDREPDSLLQRPALRDGWDHWMVVNSFSKYFGMTGWRLGWLVAPLPWVPALERLAQNLTICAPAPAQQAALACFESDTLHICEERRTTFRQRRDAVVERLRHMGLPPVHTPDGAFYVWLDVAHLCTSSVDWCRQLMEETGVCLVPGIDFSLAHGERFVRLSYASELNTLMRGLDRLEAFLRR